MDNSGFIIGLVIGCLLIISAVVCIWPSNRHPKDFHTALTHSVIGAVLIFLSILGITT